jgi:8-oxo-dGTP diphosphatase
MAICTTLCYIEKDDQYLMLLRNKKENDLNEGKWIGVGGKFLEDETPDECLLREVEEETGLILDRFALRSIVTFLSDKWETEYMFLYTADRFHGEIKPCNEGELHWIKKDRILDLNLWEGDVLFLRPLIQGKKEFFQVKVRYEGDRLVEHKLTVNEQE